MVQDDQSRKGRWAGRATIGFLAFAAIAAFFLFSEHRAHLLGVLPWALLLLCPVLHLFMHGGHAGGHRAHGASSGSSAPDAITPATVEEAGASRHA